MGGPGPCKACPSWSGYGGSLVRLTTATIRPPSATDLEDRRAVSDTLHSRWAARMFRSASEYSVDRSIIRYWPLIAARSRRAAEGMDAMGAGA